ncbi:MAG: type II toxin-antitoxin system Phd/YefM family antitoxin [Anaerolineae bacterium]
MKIVSLAAVKDQFSAYVKESQTTPIVVTKNGKPVALLTGIEDRDDLDVLLLVHNPRFVELIEQARARVRRTGGVKSDEFLTEVKRHRSRKKAA